MKINRFVHADFAKLEASILASGGFTEFDDYSMHATIPGRIRLVADLPTADPYESVDVEFDEAPSEDLLRSLCFPFRSDTDIKA